jgi:hypothetical protein
MFKKSFLNAIMMAGIVLLSGCSVYKAASNDGVSVSDVSSCKTKGCFLSHGMEIVQTGDASDGEYIEIYRAVARKSGVNYVRAAGHGALDVVTLGIWEVAGTPIEGAISNNRGYITVKTIYPSSVSEEFVGIEIYDADGKKVISQGKTNIALKSAKTKEKTTTKEKA